MCNLKIKSSIAKLVFLAVLFVALNFIFVDTLYAQVVDNYDINDGKITRNII